MYVKFSTLNNGDQFRAVKFENGVMVQASECIFEVKQPFADNLWVNAVAVVKVPTYHRFESDDIVFKV
jgi:hypothetical protein